MEIDEPGKPYIKPKSRNSKLHTKVIMLGKKNITNKS